VRCFNGDQPQDAGVRVSLPRGRRWAASAVGFLPEVNHVEVVGSRLGDDVEGTPQRSPGPFVDGTSGERRGDLVA
jgi:hypothetical protein